VREHIAPMFGDSPKEQTLLARAVEVILDPPTGTIPCMAWTRKEIFPRPRRPRTFMENSRARRRFADYRRGVLCGQRSCAAGSTGKGEENIKFQAGTRLLK